MVRSRVFLAFLFTIAAATARADQAPDADPDTDAAHRHFERGIDLYGQGHFGDAIKEFELARTTKPLPAFDYNIARCYDRMEDWPHAADEYERYLQSAPNATEAAEVKARIATLRARRNDPSAALPPALPPIALAPSPPRAPPAPARRPLLAPAVAVGVVAIAAAGAGAALYLAAASGHDDLKASCAPTCPTARWSGYQSEAFAAYALFAVAGAAAALDVVLWALHLRTSPHEPRAWLVPTVGGVAAGGVF